MPSLRLAQRCSEKAVEGNHHHIRIASVGFHELQCITAGISGHVDRFDGDRRHFLVVYDLDEPSRHLVGAAAFTCHDDQFDRFFWIPFSSSLTDGGKNQTQHCCGNQAETTKEME